MTSEKKYKELKANMICKKYFWLECLITFGNHKVFVPEDWGELTLLRFMESQGLDIDFTPMIHKRNKEHKNSINPILRYLRALL